MLKFINPFVLMLYCSFIYWLSAKPSLPTPMLFPHQDKIFHMGAYFIMGILAWRFFRDYFSYRTAKITCFCFCFLFGITDEWHQSYVPGRQADFLDLLADTLGALMALSLIYFINKKKIRFKYLID